MDTNETGRGVIVHIAQSGSEPFAQGFRRRQFGGGSVYFIPEDRGDEKADRSHGVTLIVLDGQLMNAGDANEEEHTRYCAKRERSGRKQVSHAPVPCSGRATGRRSARSPVLGFAPVDVETPNLAKLPEQLRSAAEGIGARLAESGRQAWVVGGAVRDLAIGRVPSDADLATDASTDEVEAAFPQTVPLGKRFGTVLVKWSGLGVEVTSLRAEADYEDARRPEVIQFGTSVEEDANRRDFTCNAMYLETQTGSFLDPVRGLADLQAGVLRAVGEARARFSEDGLRIFRLARFAAELALDPAPETLEGARSSLDSLRGVSAERILAELSRGFGCERGVVMLQVLVDLGVHAQLVPAAVSSAGIDAASIAGRLPAPLGALHGLLLFVDPDPLGGSPRSERRSIALSGLGDLRPSRKLRKGATDVWDLCGELEAHEGNDVDLGQVRLWMRNSAWGAASDLAIAGAQARGQDASRWLAWQEELAGLSGDALFPAPWVDAELLRELEFPEGPRWKELIAEGLKRQLGGEWDSASDAGDWLRSVSDP